MRGDIFDFPCRSYPKGRFLEVRWVGRSVGRLRSVGPGRSAPVGRKSRNGLAILCRNQPEEHSLTWKCGSSIATTCSRNLSEEQLKCIFVWTKFYKNGEYVKWICFLWCFGEFDLIKLKPKKSKEVEIYCRTNYSFVVFWEIRFDKCEAKKKVFWRDGGQIGVVWGSILVIT